MSGSLIGLKVPEDERIINVISLQGASDEPEKPETLEKANNLLMEVQDALEAVSLLLYPHCS